MFPVASRVQHGGHTEDVNQMARKSSASNPPEVVTLADLAPRRRIVGGAERRVFGSNPLIPQEHTMASKKDLPAKKTVKAGRRVPE